MKKSSIKNKDFVGKQQAMIKTTELGDILSYNDLCKYFDLEPATGNQRKVQLNEIQRYIGLEKVGAKYMLTEYYDTPLAKPPKNSKYVKYIEYILLDYLSAIPDGKVAHTKKKWYEILGLTNINFTKYSSTPDELLEKIKFEDNVELKHLQNYFSISNEAIRNIFRYAIESLEKRSLILSRKVFYIRHNFNDEYVPATDSDSNKILTIQNTVLTELGIRFASQLFYKKNDKGNLLIHDYYRLVDKYVEKEFGAGAKYFMAIEILTANVSNLNRDKENIKKNLEQVDEFKHLLNQSSIDKINHNVDREYGDDKDFLLSMCCNSDDPSTEDYDLILRQIEDNKIQRDTTVILNDKLINIDTKSF